MEIIDAHAHIYPHKIAQKATEVIGEFYDIKMQNPAGTTDNLLAQGEKAGISKYVVHSCATKPQQVRSINEFVKSELVKYDNFIGFMTLHQDLTEGEIFEEVNWAVKNGFKGVKLHPDFQKFNIDDPAAYPIYEAAEGRMPILFHAGDDRYDFSHPTRLLRIVERFPNLVVIAAHLGGYHCWDDASVYFGHPRVFIDTSSALPFMESERAASIIHAHGVDRVFFGTDSPMWNHVDEWARFNALGLSKEERQQILWDNAAKLLL